MIVRKGLARQSMSAFVRALALWVSALNGLEFEVGLLTATPERILALPLLLLSALVFALHDHKTIPRGAPALILVWLTVGLVSSLMSPVAEWSLRMWLALTLAASFFFVPVLLRLDMASVVNGKSFWCLSVVLGPVAATVFLLAIVGSGLPSVAEGWIQIGGGTRLKATASEANLLGAFLPLLLFGMLARDDKQKVGWWVIFVGLNLSMIFSFSRAPWVAYITGLLIFYVLRYPRILNAKNVAHIVLPLSLVVSFIAAITFAIYWSFSDFESISRVNSILTRLLMWELALADVSEAPVLGSGIFSFSELHSYAPELVGSETFRAAWISNLFLAVLHDTGLIGLALFSAVLLAVLRKGWVKTRWHALHGRESAGIVSAACVSAAVCILISGQSIPAHSLGFFWLSLGFAERSAANSPL